MAENVALGIELNAGNAPKTLGDLRKSVEDLNQELEKTEIGTQEYEKLRKELVKTNKEVKNLELGYEALDVEQQASELGSVAGAVGDVTSAFVLLGGESDTLEQIANNIQKAIGVSMAFKGAIEGVASARKLLNSLDKESGILKAKDIVLTKASAVAQGLYTAVVGTSTGALKLFKIALASTGIGLLIVGIGALVANWESFVKWIKSSSKALGEFAEYFLPIRSFIEWWTGKTYEQIEAENQASKQRREEQKKIDQEHAKRIKQIDAEADAQRKATQSKLKEVNKEIALAELRGEDTFRLHKKRLELQLQETKINLEQLQARLKQWEDYYRQQARMQGMSDEEFIESMKSRGVDLERLQGEFLELIEEQQYAVEYAEEEITNLVRKEREKRSAEADKVRQEQAKKDQEAFNARQKQIQEETKALMTFYDEVEKIENEYNNRFISEQDQQENAVRDKYFALIAEAEKYGEDIAILEAAREAELLDIRNDFRQQELEAKREQAEKDKENIEAQKQAERELTEAKIGFAQESLTALNAFNDLAFGAEIERIKAKDKAGQQLSKNEEKRLKRDEQIRKAFAVAQVAIDTASAISSAIAGATAAAAATGPAAPFTLAAYIASMIGTVLGGFGQVASILKTPSTDFGGAVDTPEIDVPDTEGVAQDAPDNNQFDSGSTFLDIPQKVYVLEQDITNTQDTVANIKQQATFG